ncbi:MAG: 2-oxoacid:acceptor oxidoreductase family protein [Candidatus Helarchaeota archaeon]|nr:2-oxoacid:acceptor oxidoreductase family protein [Candidatus Helarchaeota archaeon]
MKKEFNIILVGTGGQGVISASTILGWAALKMDQNNKVRTAETHGMAQRGGTVIVHLRFGKEIESPLVKINNADVMLSLELVEAVRYLNYLKPEGILLVNNDSIIPPVLFQGQHMAVDPEVCFGCGNCRINCLVNTYYQDPKSSAVITSPASRVINGHCEILSGCTGCTLCTQICNQHALRLVQDLSYPAYSEIENEIKTTSSNGFILPASSIATELGDIRMTNVVLIGALLGFEDVPLKLEIIMDSIKKNLKQKLVERNLKALEAGLNLIKDRI